MVQHTYTIRLAEYLRAVSRAGDVASCRALGFSQRVSCVAFALARHADLPGVDEGALLLATLLHGVGMAGLGGDLARTVLGNERPVLVRYPLDALADTLRAQAEGPMDDVPTGSFVRHHILMHKAATTGAEWLARSGFEGASAVLSGWLERHDGHGIPAGLAGTQLTAEQSLLTCAYHLCALHEAATLREGGEYLSFADECHEDDGWIASFHRSYVTPELEDATRTLWADRVFWEGLGLRAKSVPPRTVTHDDVQLDEDLIDTAGQNPRASDAV